MFKSKWQYVSTLVILTLVGLFFGSTPPAAYAATCTSILPGNWDDPNTWNCGVVGAIPGAGDDVVTDADVTLNIDATVKNVSIGNGDLDGGTKTLNVTGNWDYSGGGGSFIDGTGTVNLNGTGDQTIEQAIFNAVNITHGGRTVTIGHFLNTISLDDASSWTGTSCSSPLIIRSSVPGTAVNIIRAHFLTANFVDVQDSNADAVVTAQGKNSGNNTNWQITACGAAVGGVAQTIAMPTASTNGLGYLAGLAGVVMLVGAGWLVSKR